jgi:hypothetical protein
LRSVIQLALLLQDKGHQEPPAAMKIIFIGRVTNKSPLSLAAEYPFRERLPAAAQDQNMLAPGSGPASSGFDGTGFAAGKFLAEDRGDEIPAVPAGAAATRTLPEGPGGQGSGKAASTFADTAPAERRQRDRCQPHDEASGDSDNRPDTGVVST